MNTVRRRRVLIVIVGLCVLTVVSGLILYALRQNINLFYTPSQLMHAKLHPNQIIRLGGMVVKGSVVRSQDPFSVAFDLTDFKATIHVVREGILPDLFREGQGIVAIGQFIDSSYFKASEVLAKHDEKYMPPGMVMTENTKVPE